MKRPKIINMTNKIGWRVYLNTIIAYIELISGEIVIFQLSKDFLNSTINFKFD